MQWFHQFITLLIKQNISIWNCSQALCVHRSFKTNEWQDWSLPSGLMLKSAVASVTAEQLQEPAMPKFYDLQLQDAWLWKHREFRKSAAVVTHDCTSALQQQIWAVRSHDARCWYKLTKPTSKISKSKCEMNEAAESKTEADERKTEVWNADKAKLPAWKNTISLLPLTPVL